MTGGGSRPGGNPPGVSGQRGASGPRGASGQPAGQQALTPQELLDEHVFGPRVHEEVGDLRRRLTKARQQLTDEPGNPALARRIARMQTQLAVLEGKDSRAFVGPGTDVPGVGRINTRAAIQIVGPDGTLIALERGSWHPDRHAEGDALRKLVRRLQPGDVPPGSSMYIAGNQVVCPEICQRDVQQFAETYGIGLDRVYTSIRQRPRLRGTGLVSGKTTERTGLRAGLPPGAVRTALLFPAGPPTPPPPVPPPAAATAHGESAPMRHAEEAPPARFTTPVEPAPFTPPAERPSQATPHERGPSSRKTPPGGLGHAGAAGVGAILDLILSNYVQRYVDERNQESFRRQMEELQPEMDGLVAAVAENERWRSEVTDKRVYAQFTIVVTYYTDDMGIQWLGPLYIDKVTRATQEVNEQRPRLGVGSVARGVLFGDQETNWVFTVPLQVTPKESPLLTAPGGHVHTGEPVVKYQTKPREAKLLTAAPTSPDARPAARGGTGRTRSSPHFLTHTVRHGDRVWNLADRYGFTNPKQFTDLVAQANPGINFRRLRTGQRIDVPVAGAAGRTTPRAGRDIHLLDHVRSPDFHNEMRLVTPRLGQSLPTVVSGHRPDTTTPSLTHTVTHTVRLGDRVWNLADDYGFTSRRQFTDLVAQANPGINFRRLRVGQRITVPIAGVTNPATPLAGAELIEHLRRPDFRTETRLVTPRLGRSLPAVISDYRPDTTTPFLMHAVTHTVRLGDRVWNLADRYGFTDRRHFTDLVAQANPGIDFHRLRAGQRITVPVAATASRGRASSGAELLDRIRAAARPRSR